MNETQMWAIVGSLFGAGSLVLVMGRQLLSLAQKLAGGENMKDFVQRITSREFLAVGALIGYTFLITIGQYAVPEYAKTVLIPAILMFAGYMAVTARSSDAPK